MDVRKILSHLECFDESFPRAAVEAAVAQQEAITPHLLDVLEDPRQLLERLKRDPDYALHLYAFYLLAQFREQRAYPLIVDFFALHGSADIEITGDFVTECLGQVLASVCGRDMSLIRRLIEDPSVEPYVRSAGLDAVLSLVVEGVLSREEAVTYFHSLFHGGLERTTSYVWDSLICSATDLYPEELEPEIWQAYAEGLAKDARCDLAWVEEVLASGKDTTLRRLAEKRHTGYIADAATEMSWWPCFETDPATMASVPSK